MEGYRPTETRWLGKMIISILGHWAWLPRDSTLDYSEELRLEHPRQAHSGFDCGLTPDPAGKAHLHPMGTLRDWGSPQAMWRGTPAERDRWIPLRSCLSLVATTLGVMGHPTPCYRNNRRYPGETDNRPLLHCLNHLAMKVA